MKKKIIIGSIIFYLLLIFAFSNAGTHKGAWDTSTGRDIEINSISPKEIIFKTTVDKIIVYMRNDTLFFDSDKGSVFLDLSEMIVLTGPGAMLHDDIQPQTQDSSSSQIGSPSNPYGKGWFASVNPTFFFQELLQPDEAVVVASGANADFYGGFTVFSPDSFKMDSLRIIWRTNHNDVYIDSVALTRGVTRTTNDPFLIFGDGTNVGAGTSVYCPHTYAINQTISFDWRLRIYFEVATSGVGGNGYCWSAKAYCSYYY